MSIFRATSPLWRGQLKSEGHEKLLIHYAADLETIETFAQMSLQISSIFYGAIAEMYQEYEMLHKRTGRPVVMCDQDRSTFGL